MQQSSFSGFWARSRPKSKPRASLWMEPLEERTLPAGFLLPVSPFSAPLAHSDSAGGVSQVKTSDDGRYVVYTSSAPNLIPNQINQAVANNIFLFDTQQHTTTLVSHDAVFTDETANGACGFARISGDGRYIAFASAATDLVARQTGPLTGGNIYLYDTTTGIITLVSHRSDSSTISANDFSSTQPTTGFGNGAPAFNLVNDRYLIYDSYATDLIQGQTGPTHSNLYRYDVTTGTNVLISHSAQAATIGGDDDTFAADISQDGNSIAFSSLAGDLVNGEIPAAGHLANDLFLWTSSSGTAELLSGVYNPSTTKNSPTLAAGLGNFVVPAISADGLSVTFVSAATDLVVGQSASSTPATNNVFTFYTYSPLQKAFLDSSVEDTSGQPTLTEMSNGNAHAIAVAGIPSSPNNFTIAFIIDSTNILPNQGSNSGNVFLFQPFQGTRGTYTLASSIAGTNGQQGAGGCLVDPEGDLTDLSISDDGRFVSYQCDATDIVPGQASSATGPNLNVFLYDQTNADNALVSHVPGQPTTGGDNNCNASRVSADGSLVSFLSLSLNLVASATINSSGYDMYTFAVNSAGPAVLDTTSAFQANATSLVYSSSADGRYTAFTSNSPNAVQGQIDFNRDQDVFLTARDPATGATTTTLVSHVPNNLFMTGNFGSPATNAGVVNPGAPVVISPDGNWIVFVSRATNLVPGQHTGSAFVDGAFIDNVFLYDNRPGPTHGSIRLISHVAGTPNDPTADSTEGELSSFNPVISSSSNGVFVAFASYAKTLVAGLTGFQNDYFRANVFLYDVLHDTMNILSDNGTSAMVGNGDSRNPTISDNGQFIAFQSRATNLIPADTVFPTNNVYVVNQFVIGGNTTLVSHVVGNPNFSPDPSTSPGGPPTTASFNPIISADGSSIVYVSYATNLVTGQSGVVDTTDVFVYNVHTGINSLVSGVAGSPFATADNYSDSPSIDASGGIIVFRSSADDVVVGQNGPVGSNIFLANAAGITLISHAAGAVQTTALGNSTLPVVDGDGSLVAYLSTASNLVTGQSPGMINNVFGWTSSTGQNFLASGQNGSPTVISQSPAFLPIVSRDPFFFFSVTGTLLTNAVGSTNAYGNTLISILLTPTGLADGSVGTLSASSILVGQLLSVQFGLAAGGPQNDNNFFGVGATQANNTATLSFTGNVNSQAFFTVVVQMATPLGTVAQSFTLNASTGGGVLTDDYLNRLYPDVLQRPADPGGLGNFSAALDAGSLSCGAVAAAFVGSPEFRTNEVANAYLDILARPADPGGLSFWVGFLGSQPLVRLQIQFYGGVEFFNKNGGTNTAFVDALYLDILHRPADAGATVWIQALNNGASLGAVASGILNSSESVDDEVTGLYQNYLRRAPDPGGLQNNVNAILQGSATYEKELVGFVSSPEYQNDAGGDLNQNYVANLYLDILGRAADGGGLANFTGALEGGTLSRSQVVTTLLTSGEYRTLVVNNLYMEYLGRAADPQGLNTGLNILSKGGTDEQVADVLLGSGEFFTDNGGNDTGFVQALYREVLQRPAPPTQPEVNGWVSVLQQGASTGAVAAAFLVSDEYHRAIVGNFYQRYLHRAADPSGLNTFAGLLDMGQTDETVIAMLTTSAEYFAR